MSNFEITISKPKDVTGGLTAAPMSVAVPDDASTQLPAGYKSMGEVSVDGLTLSEDASDEDVYVWGGKKRRKVRNEHSVTLSGVLHSTTNPDTLRSLFGAQNVEVSKDGKMLHLKRNSDLAPKQHFTVETMDDGMDHRIAIREGLVTVSGDRTLSHASPDGIEVTIEALADADGNCYDEYWEKTDGSVFEEQTTPPPSGE